MKVRDLAALLAGFDPDLDVLVDGYEGGLDDLLPKRVRVVKYHRDANAAYAPIVGLHDECYKTAAEPCSCGGGAKAPALLLSRGDDA